MAPPPGFAPAKVNLTLHVTGRRGDGYHLLDSLVVFADVGDRLALAPGAGLDVSGPFAAGVPTGEANLVSRALALTGLRRRVRLEKNLPHPGGLGGGSSDAAATLRLLGVAPPVPALLALGADLPVCLHGGSARMRGIGEEVLPMALPALDAVLVHPGIDLPTGEVFAELGGRFGAAMPTIIPPFAAAADLIGWLAGQRNDLEDPARARAPGLGAVLDALCGSGARLARMSGSGATCFGLYDSPDAARHAAATLARPGWWVRAVRLAGPPVASA